MNLYVLSDLSPWPPLVAQVLELESTEVVSLVDGTGLVVDWTLKASDDYSNKTRKRVYRPRIDAAFFALSDDDKLRVAWVLTRELIGRHPEFEDRLLKKLAEIGWRIDAGKLVPGSSPVRELLLGPGTEYDSYVAIKKILGDAKGSIVIVDPYLDGSIFQMLAASAHATLTVRLLTSKVPADFGLEGRKFQSQYPSLVTEVRRTTEFHDRFIISDDSRCWHVGASIKDAGNKTFMISEIEDETNRAALRQAFEKSWRAGDPIGLT